MTLNVYSSLQNLQQHIIMENLKLISQEAWSYCLYQCEERYFLSVLCGSVAMYGVTVELTSEEIAGDSISSLARAIRSNPHAYNDRRINDFKYPK